MPGLFEAKPDLLVHSREPLNAEPPLDRLANSAVTAQRDFYVRTHGTIPRLDADRHRLRISGRVARPLSLTVAELRARFAPRTVTAVLQCAGNRRADFLPVRPVSGEPWEAGAIGNAAWTGIPLGDVLREAGAEESRALHVAFACADEIEKDGGRHRFCVSVSMHKALAPKSLLAFAMNDETLAPEHGHPLRAIIPGFAGVRSAKWLSAIEVRDRPADGPIQRRDYKLFPPDATAETVDWETGLTIDAMPLNAAICEPQAGAHSARGNWSCAATRFHPGVRWRASMFRPMAVEAGGRPR